MMQGGAGGSKTQVNGSAAAGAAQCAVVRALRHDGNEARGMATGDGQGQGEGGGVDNTERLAGANGGPAAISTDADGGRQGGWVRGGGAAEKSCWKKRPTIKGAGGHD